MTNERLYPDFNIDEYWGADCDENPNGDIVRVVVEVGSDGAIKYDVNTQLQDYMDVVGDRWSDSLLGLGIIGNEVLMLKITKQHKRIHNVITSTRNDHWISIFDDRFIAELQKVLEL